MKAWIEVLPQIRHLFDEIEVWAFECDIAHEPDVTWKKITTHLPTWPLHALSYQRQIRRMQANGEAEGALVQVTGCYLDHADIRYIQFWNRAYLEECSKRPETLNLSPILKILAWWTARRELKISRDLTSTRSWWVVSRLLGERIAKDGGGGGIFEVLPNQYNPQKFNLSVRSTWRTKMRNHYGVAGSTHLFVFSAFGHFERKGLLQAVEALALLKSKNHDVKFLILGGKPQTVAAFQKNLASRNINADFCIFAGLVSDIQNHLSAGDALLFPSHFEAFSLAEIEAAALGLRLYLTPHYGTEMIMRQPENGRLLPWDVAGMAEILEADLVDGCLKEPHTQMAEAMNPEEYAAKLIQLYEKAIKLKSGSQPA